MDDNQKYKLAAMPALPEALIERGFSPAPGLLKRERTRLQLVQAAVQVFGGRGVAAATIQEIAAVAGMTTGTVYNHFKTKEEVASAVATFLADSLCRRISESQRLVKEGAQRMAIGNQRYVWLAQKSPAWAQLLLEVSVAAPQLLATIGAYALADLRLGVRQKSFRIPSEAAAMDLINGSVAQAMRSVVMGAGTASHGRDVAVCVLRGLGMSHADATEVAQRPLPPFPTELQPVAAAKATRRPR